MGVFYEDPGFEMYGPEMRVMVYLEHISGMRKSQVLNSSLTWIIWFSLYSISHFPFVEEIDAKYKSSWKLKNERSAQKKKREKEERAMAEAVNAELPTVAYTWNNAICLHNIFFCRSIKHIKNIAYNYN